MEDIQYYIIKNPDTGLYYRGKGVNRWGKYMNQASIFRIKGQVEESCNWINREHRNGERAVIVPIKIIEEPVEIQKIISYNIIERCGVEYVCVIQFSCEPPFPFLLTS